MESLDFLWFCDRIKYLVSVGEFDIVFLFHFDRNSHVNTHSFAILPPG